MPELPSENTERMGSIYRRGNCYGVKYRDPRTRRLIRRSAEPTRTEAASCPPTRRRSRPRGGRPSRAQAQLLRGRRPASSRPHQRRVGRDGGQIPVFVRIRRKRPESRGAEGRAHLRGVRGRTGPFSVPRYATPCEAGDARRRYFLDLRRLADREGRTFESCWARQRFSKHPGRLRPRCSLVGRPEAGRPSRGGTRPGPRYWR
jgi:hypothetical protein